VTRSFHFQSEYNAHLVGTFLIFHLKIINYNCSGHKFNIFLKYFGSFLKWSFQWYALYEIIFLQKKFHRNYVLNLLTFEIVCAQYKWGNSSLYLVFLLICQFIIECTDVDAFIAALDIGLLPYLIRFLWLLLVERLLIVHYRLNVIFHYYSFFVNSLNLTFLLLPSVNCKDDISE
jgi:hypothetical protein